MSWNLGRSHKPNHNSYALYYHVVFVTYKREPLIDREVAGFLQEFFPSKCAELEVRLLEQGILCDHVHLLISLRPTHYIPEVLGYLKGTSAHEANHHHDFRNVLRWMRGYHISTVSERALEAARQYVREQHKRHPDRVPV
ncbi:MAG TPA: IS200/IS605 family transposase [Thermoflexia bacterium]|nr:IS200/IS605 family transposase [Thermoflexia bacterium]